MNKKIFTNRKIADVLHTMSICYEMEGVEFKPAAYERAAETIEALSEEAVEIFNRGGAKALDELPSIGPAIAAHIEKLLTRGTFTEYDRCRRKMPDDVLTLTSVPDLGPRKVKILYDRLHVRTLNDLERAARAEKIRELPGFGQKSEEKILRGIALLRQSGQRRLLGEILPVARELEQKLNALPGIKRAVVTGSVRRRQETIGDLDVVMTAANTKKAMNGFAELDLVRRVLKRGPRNITVMLTNNMTCDVMIVPDDVFGAAVQHFTGNKDHNVALRKMASEKGFKLNEYGLWRGRKRLAAKTEQEIYSALGLPYIEPELRTASGELEAASAGRLPNLLPYRSVRGDLQVQTEWTDGVATIEEMAAAARAAGLEYIAITDHTRTLAMVGGLNTAGLAKQAREIDRLNADFKKHGINFTVFKSAEVNILKDGSLDIPDAALQKLDIVAAAIHSNFNLSQKEQTARLIRAMKNPNVDIIFHPTGQIIGRREPINLDLDKFFRAAKETGTVLEINSYPERSDLNVSNIRTAIAAGVKLVIDTDAHHPEHFRYLELGEALARRGWAEKKDILNTMSAAALQRWFAKPKNKRS